MLKIRLSRTGKKKQPSYRVVVADINAKRDGRVVERIGFYNPLVDPIEFRIQEDRALYWLSVGAQPTDAVERLLVKQGTIERLSRLRAGESLDELVAEFSGVPAEAAVSEVEEAVAETAVEAEPVAEVAEETAEEAAAVEAEEAEEGEAEEIEKTAAETAEETAEEVEEKLEEDVAEAEEDSEAEETDS